MFRASSFFLLSACALGLIACDSDPEVDAGPPDSGAAPVDGGPSFTCASAIEVTGVLDDVVSQTVDTTMVDEAPRDLGLTCGNPSAELRWAPQAVIAFEVPGSGPVAVQFSTINEVTPPEMAVVVQARHDCEMVPEQSFPSPCFGPLEPRVEWRAQGAVPAMGGETLYFVVTGYTDVSEVAPGVVDRGPVRIDFTVSANEKPTLDAADLVLIGADLRADASGSDADGNVTALLTNYYDEAGLLDLYGTGAPTESNSLFAIPLDDPAPTGTSWTGGAWVRSTPDDMRTQLGEYLIARGATMARVIAVDDLNGVSEPLMVPLVQAEIVGYGETCGAARRCDVGYTCGAGGTCEASAAAMAACGAATDAMLPAFTDQAVTVTVTDTTGTDPGNFDPLAGCVGAGEAAGDESVYQVDVASGTFDLLLSTATPITGRTDTVIYVRTACAEPPTELGCNDDIGGGVVASELELRDLAPGTYYVFVEQVVEPGLQPRGHALEITARPVLTTGASCDDAEVLNRCASGACTMGTCP